MIAGAFATTVLVLPATAHAVGHNGNGWTRYVARDHEPAPHVRQKVPFPWPVMGHSCNRQDQASPTFCISPPSAKYVLPVT